jgi:hypothetical protein
MGLEMTGLARPNAPLVWADPADYQDELAQAVDILATAGITTRIYNHQLCVLDRRLWPYAVRSISDWKNDYLEICHSCSVRNACGGVFTQAATASASTCAHYRDQPAETETQGTPPPTGLVFDLSEPHIPARLKPRAEPWRIGSVPQGCGTVFAWSCRW